MDTNQNNKVIYRGSEWRRWDLHIHSPATYRGSYDEFVKNLKTSEVEVIGINDYCTIKGYEQVIFKFGETGDKILFPVIEFRMNNMVLPKNDPRLKSGPRINFHIIFDNDINLIPRIKTWLNSLNCFYEGGKQEKLGNVNIPEDSLKVTFDYLHVVETLEKEEGLKGNFLVWLPYDEYGGIDNIDPKNDGYFKLGLINKTSIIGSSNKKQIDFFLWKSNRHNEEKIKKWLNERQIPCIKGSDAHKIDYPFGKLKDQSSQPIDKYCWIKAEPTFEGLKQIIYEPKDRIFIGRENPALFGHAVVDSFNAPSENKKFFLKKIGNIYFNPGLNCVIGSRGSGKSTLLDAVALSLGDTDVLDEKRNNYIGFFFRRNDQDIITANVRHSSAGEIKELSPNTAKDSGFLFDYYYQKQIGYFADPNNEYKLSRFLFDKIFQEDTGASSLFNELKEQRDTFTSKLAVNREKIVGYEKEISKEEKVRSNIKDKKSRAKFLIQPAIKDLLAERNKIIKLRERIKRVKNRLENIEEKPLISDKEAVDTNFFNELLLSEFDPEGTVLPKEWKDLEKEASSFLESLGTNKEELKKQITKLTVKIIELAPLFDFNERLNAIWEEIKTESAKQNLTIKKDDLGKLDSIQKDLLILEKQLEEIKECKEEKQTLLGERKRLLDNYIVYLNSGKEKLEESFKKLLKGNGAILNNTIKLEIETVFPIESYLECIQEKTVHDLEDDLPNFPSKKPLLELFKSLGSEKLIISFRSNNFEDWNVPGLGTRSLDYFKKIKNKEEIAMHLEELLPDLTSRLLWRPDLTKEFKPLKNCSIGERGTALLSIILIAGAEPLIIDQPEDDLDHFYLYKTLTPIIKEVKKRRQLIFATHDANIVVNGDAELISIVTTEDGEFGDITPTSIENLKTREKVMDVLEGGKTAFIRREKKYGLK
jgi:energy-coupling factor transporter ATP-binding protein EcfA2